MSLEQSAVADDGERRTAISPAFQCDFPSSRPAAALEHPGKRKLAGAPAQAFAHKDGKTIEQGHRQRPPLDDGLAQRVEWTMREARVARLDNATIKEQAAVAVFGKSGQPVELGDLQTGFLQRLDQRVGEPLG